MNPLNSTSAEETNKLDLQNQYDFRTNLQSQLSGADALRNQRRLNNIASVGGITTQIPSTISTASLTNTKAINIPTSTSNTPNIAGGSIQGIAEGLNTNSSNELQSIISDEQKKAEEAQKATETSKSGIQSLIDKLSGKGEAQVQAEVAGGINEKKQLLTDITNEYNTKSLEFRRAEEAILKQPGISRDSANQQIAELRRVNNQELADIAIKQSVAQNNLATTQSIIDRKIDLEYGDLKDIIGYQQNFLEMNRADLSKAEQNILNTKITENTRKYEEGKSIAEFAKEVAKNGADAGTIARVSSAKSMTEAIQSAGQYGVDPLDRELKIAEINAKNRSNLGIGTGGTGVVSALTQSVIDNPSLYYGFTPTQKAAIVSELQTNGYDISNLQNVKLSTSQQEDLSSMGTVKSLIDDVLSYQKNGALPGIGYQIGSLKGLGAQLGFGSEEEKSVRANIGNIKGTIAKLRGGTSFTTNEEKLLNTYTPSINDSSGVAINKLINLKKFIDQKNNSLIGVVQINPTKGQITKQGEQPITRPEDLRAKYSY